MMPHDTISTAYSMKGYPKAMKHTERVLAIAPDYTLALKRLIGENTSAEKDTMVDDPDDLLVSYSAYIGTFMK